MSSTNWQNYPKYNTTCTCSNMQTVELSLRTWIQNSKHRQKSPSTQTWLYVMYHMGLKSINQYLSILSVSLSLCAITLLLRFCSAVHRSILNIVERIYKSDNVARTVGYDTLSTACTAIKTRSVAIASRSRLASYFSPIDTVKERQMFCCFEFPSNLLNFKKQNQNLHNTVSICK